MKKTTNSKIFGLSLATSLVLASSITVQAVTNPIKGDFNNDGIIDSKDSAILKTNILLASKDTTYDVNADTKINILDYIALSKMFVHTPLTNNTNITSAFTDENFKNAIYALIGKNGPVPILYSDVKNLKNLNISSMNISSLSGIEYFTSLTSLYCASNQLTSLDISKNISLTYLNCKFNQLTNLDVSKNTSLTELWCDENQLQTLDISNNVLLDKLSFYNNKISTMDVTKNTMLTYLDCSNNKLTTISIANNTALAYLSCPYNQLTTLDITKNVALTYLSCPYNQLTTMDVSNNTLLTYLDCENNFLSNLNINTNAALTFFNCSHNNIVELYYINDAWNVIFYKTQYIDTSHTNTTDTLTITTPTINPRTVIFNKVKEITASELGCNVEDIMIDSSFMEDLGADEIGVANLMMRFEDEFGMEIPDSVKVQLNYVYYVVEYIVNYGTY